MIAELRAQDDLNEVAIDAFNKWPSIVLACFIFVSLIGILDTYPEIKPMLFYLIGMSGVFIALSWHIVRLSCLRIRLYIKGTKKMGVIRKVFSNRYGVVAKIFDQETGLILTAGPFAEWCKVADRPKENTTMYFYEIPDAKKDRTVVMPDCPKIKKSYCLSKKLLKTDEEGYF